MTHVTIYRNKENECIGFTVIGHAEICGCRRRYYLRRNIHAGN